jgi:hypothetical protein
MVVVRRDALLHPGPQTVQQEHQHEGEPDGG